MYIYNGICKEVCKANLWQKKKRKKKAKFEKYAEVSSANSKIFLRSGSERDTPNKEIKLIKKKLE